MIAALRDTHKKHDFRIEHFGRFKVKRIFNAMGERAEIMKTCVPPQGSKSCVSS